MRGDQLLTGDANGNAAASGLSLPDSASRGDKIQNFTRFDEMIGRREASLRKKRGHIGQMAAKLRAVNAARGHGLRDGKHSSKDKL